MQLNKLYFFCLLTCSLSAVLDPFESHLPPDPNDYATIEDPSQHPAPQPPPLLPPAPPLRGSFDAHVLFDLETLAQDFVLETKQIEIPGFFGAFNPSIARWGNALVLSFRVRDPKTGLTHKFGLAQLDESFNLIGEPQVIELPVNNPYHPSRFQDPRLVVIAGRLFITYSNVLEGKVPRDIRRMYFAEVRLKGGLFDVQSPECISHFQGEHELRWEKNWAPVDYNGHLFLVYSLNPHRIVAPIPGTGIAATVSSTRAPIPWNWGDLRGGSPAIREGGEYLAFFHSSINMSSVHSEGKNIQHYFMGAYTFSLDPPFGITRISEKPIIGQQFYHGRAYKTWKPLHVVFPAGFISDEQYIWVIYGRQDFEIWVVKLDKQGLFNSLVPVSSVAE